VDCRISSVNGRDGAETLGLGTDRSGTFGAAPNPGNDECSGVLLGESGHRRASGGSIRHVEVGHLRNTFAGRCAGDAVNTSKSRAGPRARMRG
jgi:hypothetical protein